MVSTIVNDHGDGPKLNDLPGIVSQRYRDVWSDVRYVEVHRGHLHTNKAYKMQAVEELNGLTVRNLSSMSATDEWHDQKGYVGNINKASAFVWSAYNGVQAKLNYNEGMSILGKIFNSGAKDLVDSVGNAIDKIHKRRSKRTCKARNK